MSPSPRKLGDANPPLIVQITAEAGFVLTGAQTVAFNFTKPDETEASRACTISDPATNQVTCVFDGTDFDQEGHYKGEFVVTDSGLERTFPPKDYVEFMVFAEI